MILSVFVFVLISRDCFNTVHVESLGVTLLGPVQRGSGDCYELEFHNPLQKGQGATISFEIAVKDPDRTMRPFLSDRFHNAARYGSFRASYLFQPRPTSIRRERSTVSGETLESQDLLPKAVDGGFLYDFSVERIDSHCVYTVSWVW